MKRIGSRSAVCRGPRGTHLRADPVPLQSVRVPSPGIQVFRERLTRKSRLDGKQHDVQGDLTGITIILDGELPIVDHNHTYRQVTPGEAIHTSPSALLFPWMERIEGTVEILQVFISPVRFQGVSQGPGKTELAEIFRIAHPRAAGRMAAGFGTAHPLASGDMEQLLIDWWGQEPFLRRFLPQITAHPLDSRRSEMMDRIHWGEDSAPAIESLSSSCGRSRFSFYREFMRDWGLSPMPYLQTVRLGRALELLSLDRTPSTALPVKAGFRDISRFYRYFGQVVGTSPNRFVSESGF